MIPTAIAASSGGPPHELLAAAERLAADPRALQALVELNVPVLIDCVAPFLAIAIAELRAGHLEEVPCLVEKPHDWGFTRVYAMHGHSSLFIQANVKVLFLRPGTSTSHHRHGWRFELHTPLTGIAPTVPEYVVRLHILEKLTSFLITPHSPHLFSGVEDPGVVATFEATVPCNGKDRVPLKLN